jgi:branched-subunit amino acid ABC-type transport system permease component
MVIAASVPEDFFRALLQGLPAGSVYALFALGFVLTYKTSGVFNLAFGAQAFVSAAVFYELRETNGWALVPALVVAIREISAGPLVLGPLFAFAIALSDMTILGLGSFFWSLVLGTAISLFLEREGWRELRSDQA